jgi:DNA-directed RNA polymerase I subunit RPA1
MRSLVEPGEAVGLLASQGVGEPSTQMTLNTFHLAGHGAANVTLGIPRLREIVMTASQKPQTPTMKLPLRESTSDEAVAAFTKEVSRLTLAEVVERVTVTEQLTGKDLEYGNSRLRKYRVHLQFYPPEEYTTEYDCSPLVLHESLAFNFAARLKKEVQKELATAAKAAAQDEALGKGRTVHGNEEAEEEEGTSRRRGRDEDLGIDDDDGDAGQDKRTRQARQHEYEEDEREHALADLEDNIEALADEEEEEEEMDIDPAQKAATDAQADAMVEMFKLASKYATSFSFDTVNGKSAEFDLQFPAASPKLLLVDLIERCCRQSVVHEVHGIGRCMRIFDDKGQFTVSPSGAPG